MGRRSAPRGELAALRACCKLEAHTLRKCKGGRAFPKTMRAGLPLRMENEAVDAVAFVMDANACDLRDAEEARLRLDAQRAALRELRKLAHHVELAHETGYLGAEEFAYWAELANEAISTCAGWHRADRRRACRETA